MNNVINKTSQWSHNDYQHQEEKINKQIKTHESDATWHEADYLH